MLVGLLLTSGRGASISETVAVISATEDEMFCGVCAQQQLS